MIMYEPIIPYWYDCPDKVYKKLKGYSLEKNKKLSKRLSSRIKELNDKAKKMQRRAWNIRNCADRMKVILQSMDSVIGERKGKDCPARQRGSYGRGFRCTAWKSKSWSIPEKEAYRKYCCHCRLTYSQAETRTVIRKLQGEGK